MKENLYVKMEYNMNDLTLDLYFDKENLKIWLSRDSISKLSKKTISSISRLTTKKILNNEIVYGKNYINFLISKKKYISLYDLEFLELLVKDESLIGELKSYFDKYIFDYKIKQMGKIYFKDEKLIINEYYISDSIFFSKDDLLKLFEVDFNINKDIYDLNDLFLIGYTLDNQKAKEFRIWANLVLSSALINGYYIDNEKCRKDKKKMIEITSIADNIIIKDELSNEEKEKYYSSIITFNNNTYDSDKFIYDLIRDAKKQIVIISKYLNDSIYELLDNSNVSIKLLTSSKAIITKFMSYKFMKNHTLKVQKKYEIDNTYLIIDNIIYEFNVPFTNITKENCKCHIIDMDYNKLISNLKIEKRLN